MTRKFNASVTQTGLAGWIRNNPNLDSVRHGITMMDSDLWVHRYKTEFGRNYQFLMLIEIKEFGKAIDDSQRDTLHIINQLLRNRRNTRTEWNATDIDASPRVAEVNSLLRKDRVSVLCYGAHLLRVDGDGTFAQWSRLHWDGHGEISHEQLEQLLRFELDPDTLGKLDHRPAQRHGGSVIVREDRTDLGMNIETAISLRPASECR